MGLKVFHTGDLHLGMLFKNRGYSDEIREELIEARYRVLEQMIERANQEECHLFVVAGDLFERLGVKEEQILRVAKTLSRFSGVCAVLPGNHDYYTPGSFLWEKFQKNAADNLLLLLDTQPYSLKDYGLDVVLYPAPCHAKYSEENRMQWILNLSEKPEGQWHLSIAHGSVEGYSPDFYQNYFPIREEELTSSWLHFCLLGHTHVRIPSREEFEDIKFAYCGTPEPDGFDCRHQGSAWIIQFDDEGKVEGKAVITGNYRFKDLERTVNKGEDLDELVRELSKEGERTLVRLKLLGILPREDYENRQKWRDEMEDKLFYLEWDDTQLQMEISREIIAELFSEGSFPYLLLDRLAQKEDQKALQIAYALIKEVEK